MPVLSIEEQHSLHDAAKANDDPSGPLPKFPKLTLTKRHLEGKSVDGTQGTEDYPLTPSYVELKIITSLGRDAEISRTILMSPLLFIGGSETVSREEAYFISGPKFFVIKLVQKYSRRGRAVVPSIGLELGMSNIDANGVVGDDFHNGQVTTIPAREGQKKVLTVQDLSGRDNSFMVEIVKITDRPELQGQTFRASEVQAYCFQARDFDSCMAHTSEAKAHCSGQYDFDNCVENFGQTKPELPQAIILKPRKVRK